MGKYNWNRDAGFLDGVKDEEKMEKNLHQKKMEEKMKLKGKITGKDMEYFKKLEMRQRQLALKAIHAYSKSLSDSHGLHPPIIMKEEKNEKEKTAEADGKKKKEEEPAKIGKKQQEI